MNILAVVQVGTAGAVAASTVQLVSLALSVMTLVGVALVAYQVGRLVHRIDVVERQQAENRMDIDRLFPRRFRPEPRD